ncbi:pyochelin biosynthesis editing thioesterase PchC [Amycolatopsis oliviviridis]|uniref:Pyochelin biosynthetic protein PchC n=1 Tax=Amycolatopsis oliviviridis TaxID=1471590 RepID=A0ABQ3L3N1_9PSEU|nr:alpha/beta fold hydrolase [Amycolatopsis oliviviridis]GHH01440.1 pyochelin biosynthetic protein PchC [Amycolatopsis oliviviridis]
MSDPVVCLPYAGAGAGFFRNWQEVAPSGVDLLPVQLPGREERTDEPPHRDVRSAVDAMLRGTALRDAAAGRRPVAVFGHSLGAVLAFELARAVEERTEITMSHVFVSGSPAPARGRAARSADLDPGEFLARVEELAGYRHPAFEVAEFRELLLPTLRADVAMHESYEPASPHPIDAPITCLRGVEDMLVSQEDAMAWAEATSGSFAYVELPGGHMYLTEDPEGVMGVIASTLDSSCG